MRPPRLTEVFQVRESSVDDIPVVTQKGQVQARTLPRITVMGVKDALESDGKHLPYTGEPPEGSFFFLQDPQPHVHGPLLCLHVEGPQAQNFYWQSFEGGVDHDEEGDFEIHSDDGPFVKKGNALGKDPDRKRIPKISPESGFWLGLTDQELEPWIRNKLRRKHLRAV